MGSVVAKWTGREAKALREAKRMSVRDFASHLGMSEAAVTSWEQRDTEAQLRYETQQMLDTELAQAGSDATNRFALLLRGETFEDLRSAEIPPSAVSVLPSPPELGDRSRRRSEVLLETVAGDFTGFYRPVEVAVTHFNEFLTTAARVFVLAGRGGSGKTRLTQYLARRLAEEADFQFHSCSTLKPASADLAADIVRYASLAPGDDALLQLEQASDSLTRPCVVIIDGISSDEDLNLVGHQVDGVLRQVCSRLLRFVVVVRTPPEPDFSAYPILAASIFGTVNPPVTMSMMLSPWATAEARELWDHERQAHHVPFDNLPVSLQTLARVPLYMSLLRDAGEVTRSGAGSSAAYQLVDHCVRALLISSPHPVEATIRQLADVAGGLTPDVIPAALETARVSANSTPTVPAQVVVPFVEHTRDAGVQFTHDVFREYFLATRIVELLIELGRSSVTVAAFNELAAHAVRSAAVRGVFDFVLCALDLKARHLLEMIALAPSVEPETTLPMMLETTTAHGIPMSTDVVRACTQRCVQTPNKPLAQAILGVPNLAVALGDQHAAWLATQLRLHGSQLWDDLAEHIERTLDVRISTQIVSYFDPDQAEHATFLARYVDLFCVVGEDQLLQRLELHIDWRVRAALAEALLHRPGLNRTHIDQIADRLVNDDDYKVRAAVARTISVLKIPGAHSHLRKLLTDRNWHVRECALQAVLTGAHQAVPDPDLARTVITTVARDTSWADPPASTAKRLTRLLLLTSEEAFAAPLTDDTALFGLLRELRTGWLRLPNELEETLVGQGEASSDWLTAREAALARQRHAHHAGSETNASEDYRRHRGRRSLQIALDVHSLDRAIAITSAAVHANAAFIEVGDPLIKRVGIQAVSAIKQAALDTTIIAEMMSADWGQDQVELAAEAGADAILLIGPASTASVSAAVAAARRLGVALAIDVPAAHISSTWIRDMERAGIDGFVVTTNIDLGVAGNHPLTAAAMIRTHSRLPVAISGGFSTATDALSTSDDWDIAIVGRSVADAVSPTDIANELAGIAHKIHNQERQ